MAPRVPKSVTPAVRQFCSEIVSGAQPRFLAVTPTEGGVLDCFITVADHVASHGGSVCYGWRIWEEPRLLIEAEFHAVWRTPEGNLVDISPNPLGVDQILFSLTHTGCTKATR